MTTPTDGRIDLDALAPCPHEHQQRSLGLSIVPIAEGNSPRWYVRCLDCGATGPRTGTRESAIAAWNRRAPQTEAMPVAAKADRVRVDEMVTRAAKIDARFTGREKTVRMGRDPFTEVAAEQTEGACLRIEMVAGSFSRGNPAAAVLREAVETIRRYSTQGVEASE